MYAAPSLGNDIMKKIETITECSYNVKHLRKTQQQNMNMLWSIMTNDIWVLSGEQAFV